jgi:hypothetical protein
MGIGLGAGGAALAIALLIVSKQKSKLAQSVIIAKVRVFLMFLATAGILAVVDGLLRKFDGSLHSIWGGVVNTIDKLGLPNAGAWAAAALGAVAVVSIINIAHDCWPRERPGKDTYLAAQLLAVVIAIGLGGELGKLLLDGGTGMAGAADQMAAVLFGG